MSEWQTTKIEEIINVVNDKQRQLKSTEYELAGLYPIVDQSSDFIAGWTDQKEKCYSGKLPVIVFGDHTRHVKFIDFNFVTGADGTQLIRAIDGINQKYLYYIVVHSAELIGNYGYDRHFKHLKDAVIKLTYNGEEQQKIAKILTTIDQLIEKTQALIDKHTAIKQGMMADLFTRGIDPTTGQLRPPVEQAPHLYKETELGWVPKEWDVTRLDIAVTFLDGQRIPLKQEDRADMRGDIPYYGASGIIDYVNDYIFDDDLILLGEDGENVISRNVPLSFQINGKSWVNNHAHVLKPISGNDIEYLTEYLEYQDYSSIISGSAQPKITQGLLAKMKIKLPKLAEQIRIGSHIQTVKQMLDKEEHYLEKLKIQKQGLMQDLLTGKVFV